MHFEEIIKTIKLRREIPTGYSRNAGEAIRDWSQNTKTV